MGLRETLREFLAHTTTPKGRPVLRNRMNAQQSQAHHHLPLTFICTKPLVAARRLQAHKENPS